MADSSQAAPKGKIFDSRYQIYEIVGRGASSVVYRAKHVLNDDKEIALKVLLPNKGKEHNSDLLRHESLALITARHKNVIRLEDFRSVDSICYLAMEYAPEANLGMYFQRHNSRLPIPQIERFFLQITEALAFLHNIGMLHRDIKPENILVINNRQVRLSDFGVATLPGQTTTTEELQKGVGTLDYMAPEIFKGEVSGPGADVYSLALTFYEMFSGHHPFRDLPIAKAMEAREKMSIAPLHVLNKEIPVHLSKAISIALESDLEKRFYNAIEFLNFLKNKEQSEVLAPDDFSIQVEDNSHQKQAIANPQPSVSPAPQVKIELAPPVVKKVAEPENYADPVELVDNPNNDWDEYSEDFVTEQAMPEEQSEDEFFNNVDQLSEDSNPQQNPFEDFDDFDEPEVDTLTHADRDTPTNFNDFNYQQQIILERRTPLWQNLLFYGLAGLILYFGYQTIFSPSQESPKEKIVQNTEIANEITFPKLPSGIYSGSITGLNASGTTPLTLISLPNSQQIAVLVGVAGWQPLLIDPESLSSSELHVKSNGIDLYLQGTAVDGIIKGKFTNKTNNTEGTWSIASSQS